MSIQKTLFSLYSPSLLAHIRLLLPFPGGSLTPEGRACWQHLFRAKSSKVPHSLPNVWLCVCIFFICWSSQIMAEQVTDLWVQQNDIRGHLSLCFSFVLILFLFCIWLFFFSLAILVLFFSSLGQSSIHWLLKQCWVPVLSGRVGLNLNQVLAGYPHSFCSSIALTFLASQRPLEFKGLCLVSVYTYLW